jgi:predicted ATPase/DNA-binding winged helix-turn-helix (wHTH) protein
MMNNAIWESKDVFSFGPFTLLPTERRLEKDGLPVSIGSRAFDILLILITHASEIVSKTTLLKHAWPNVIVDEGSLRFQVNALRKTLGEGGSSAEYVSTVQGQGYRFVASVSRVASAEEAEERALSPGLAGLPSKRTRLVGRDPTVRLLAQLLIAKRFVTIVGPGGIGKTSVAMSVAQSMNVAEDLSVCFVDLGAVADSKLVASSVASALGVTVYSDDPAPAILAFLKEKRLLLVLDCCEHVIDSAAQLANCIFQHANETCILVTSREPLRVESEHIYRLPPLAFPPDGPNLTVNEAMTFPAVQLFVDRASMWVSDFSIGNEDAEAVALICRRLDGIPLAIEFAAGQLEAFGIQRLTALLDDRFQLLWRGQRTALPRHQTLNAVLDWSYALLSAEERQVLRRLSIFAGSFTIESAQSVAATDAIDSADIVAVVASLIAKSLVSANVAHLQPRYRLLDTTRAYALQKLEESEELKEMQFRHAAYFHDALSLRTKRDQMGSEHLRELAHDVDDMRVALNWAFSAEGDPLIAIGLTASSAQIWLGAGLLAECKELMTRALSNFEMSGAGPRQEMLIHMALGAAVMFTVGIGREFKATWNKVLIIAENIGDADGQLTALLTLWAQQIRLAEFAAALELAERAAAVAATLPDPGTQAMTDWMVGLCMHHLGRLNDAKIKLEESFTKDTEASRQRILRQFGYDRRVDALGVFANLLWTQGFADKALMTNSLAMTEASRLNYAVPVCVAKAWHGFNSYLTAADFAQTESELKDLVEFAQRHGIESYHGFGLCLVALCREGRDHIETTVRSVLAGLELLSKSQYKVFHPIFRAQLARALAAAGRFDDSLLQLHAIEDEDHNSDYWCRAEIIRIRGDIHAMRGETGPAEELLTASVAHARQQGALGWELRAASSLARFYMDRQEPIMARATLAPVFSRFTEGFSTRDLLEARSLLAGMQGG